MTVMAVMGEHFFKNCVFPDRMPVMALVSQNYFRTETEKVPVMAVMD